MKERQTRIMALDVGDVRIGVALSDKLKLTAQPYTTIEIKGLKKNFSYIKLIVQQEEVDTIVIGLPKNLNGAVDTQGNRVIKFCNRLKAYLKNELPDNNIEILLWDERFSTAQAQRVLIGSGLKNKQKSRALDKISATIILDSFINSKNNNITG